MAKTGRVYATVKIERAMLITMREAFVLYVRKIDQLLDRGASAKERKFYAKHRHAVD